MRVAPAVAASADSLPESAALAARKPAIPAYLEQAYWWAYVHPAAVRLFEREWLVDLILFGNYRRLRNAALDSLGGAISGSTLQIACVYGSFTARLRERLAPDALLTVIDVVPIQLDNLASKLPRDERVAMMQADSSSLPCADGSYDQALLFFLLHEQPDAVRRRTLAQALRVVRPGGKIVVVDYHRPVKWHPLRLLMTGIFSRLEPYAMDLWRHELVEFLPDGIDVRIAQEQTFCGGLYQKLVLIRC